MYSFSCRRSSNRVCSCLFWSSPSSYIYFTCGTPVLELKEFLWSWASRDSDPTQKIIHTVVNIYRRHKMQFAHSTSTENSHRNEIQLDSFYLRPKAIGVTWLTSNLRLEWKPIDRTWRWCFCMNHLFPHFDLKMKRDPHPSFQYAH